MGDVDLLALEQIIRAPFRSGGAKVRDPEGKILFLPGPERIAKTRGKSQVYLNTLQFGDIGAKLVASELKTNTDCQSLWLYGNDITEIGATELAKGLRQNTTLRVLDLHNNKIGNEGAKELAKTLKSLTSLTLLNLCGNGIGPRLPQALSKHPSLRTLCFETENIVPLVSHDPWTKVPVHVDSSSELRKTIEFEWDPGSRVGITGISTMIEPWNRHAMPTLFPGLTPLPGGLSGVSRKDPEFDSSWKDNAQNLQQMD